MRVLFVMDEVETVVPARDTSLALIVAAEARGDEVHHCLAADISMLDGRVHASTRPITSAPDDRHGMVLGAVDLRELAWFDAVCIRTDPPFDHDYLTLTLLLEHAPDDVVVVNAPRGLRDANEKLYALRFPALTPTTIVSAEQQVIVDFITDAGGAVIKPVDGHGGVGVLHLRPGDPNTSAVLEAATRRGRRVVVAQQFLPQVRDGDKRILLLDGEPLGAILRVPTADDFRATITRGEVLRSELTAADRRIVETIAPALRREGLWFVGIDVIDGHLTEVNVTSPTGLCQLAALDQTDPAATVVAGLDALVARGGRRADLHSMAHVCRAAP